MSWPPGMLGRSRSCLPRAKSGEEGQGGLDPASSQATIMPSSLSRTTQEMHHGNQHATRGAPHRRCTTNSRVRVRAHASST
eukprot:1038181-Pelagomonas_calceolata.AAC.3